MRAARRRFGEFAKLALQGRDLALYLGKLGVQERDERRNYGEKQPLGGANECMPFHQVPGITLVTGEPMPSSAGPAW